jgi:DNA-binding transcriptional ArsR family regulator
MSAVPYRKVDRHQIYKEIAKLIEESANNEVEVSSSDLADRFGVQSPTMDYHLGKLLEEGLLAVSPKRGRYNRKIYRLPVDAKKPQMNQKEKPNIEVHKPFTNIESANKFQEFLKQHKKKIEDPPVQEEEKIEVEEKKLVAVAETQAKKDEVAVEVKTPEPPKEKPQPVQSIELTLDDRIKQFLEDASMVHDPTVLLKHEDREILSVMNETMQQTSVYLKDLSEQLSTIQNKALIQGLIDDRNRMQKQLERVEKEADEARSQVDKTIEKYEVDPDRVRFMHQLIISTVDSYVNLPNHAMALGRQEFRNKVSKEINDLTKYVLHLEK